MYYNIIFITLFLNNYSIINSRMEYFKYKGFIGEFFHKDNHINYNYYCEYQE